MEWLRGNATTRSANRELANMGEPTDTAAASPCCKLMLILIPRGSNETDHYRCAECGELYVWSGSAWVLCELQEKHRRQSQETVRR